MNNNLVTDDLGKIRLYNGDCMGWIKSVPDNYYDLAIVDPPYGIGNRLVDGGGTNGMIRFQEQYNSKKWDEHIPNEEYFKELFRISKN